LRRREGMAKKKGGKKKPGMQKGKVKEPVRQKGGIPRSVLLVTLFLALALALFLMLRSGNTDNGTGDVTSGKENTDTQKPVATLELENGGIIKVELDPVNAPNTVKNFIALADEGFYDGLTFHRVIPDFMIQGGCPEGTGQGGPGYSIRGEFAANGHTNELVHERGVISMARSLLPDSAGSQFFITVEKKPHLDGEYAAFGTVIEGMDEVDRIVAVPTGQADKPLEEVRIMQITVEKFGADYGPPEKI
jgi:peptidyl-prolyl cis-trans isomerase B (cyclophilin B)